MELLAHNPAVFGRLRVRMSICAGTADSLSDEPTPADRRHREVYTKGSES